MSNSEAEERVAKAFPGICLDYSYFKQTLKQLRVLDDSIIVKLNSNLRTQPSDAQVNAESCQHFKEALLASYSTRQDIIDTCVPWAEKKLNELGREPGNLELRKELDLMCRERTVEDIVRERTAEVFKTKCRPLKLDSLGQ